MEPATILAAAAILTLATLAALAWRANRALRARLAEEYNRAGRAAQLAEELAVARASVERIPRLEERLEAAQGVASDRGAAAAAAEARVGRLEAELATLRQRSSELELELRAATTTLGQTRTALEERERAWDGKRQELEDLHKSLRDQFEALAGRILEEKGVRFSQQHTENLTKLLVPFREQLDGLRREMGDASVKEAASQAKLELQLEHLMSLNKNLAEEATNLTRALTGQGKVRGDWGETITEQLLQRAGLLEGRHYRRQASGTNEHGKRLQPDFVVELPNRRHVVIDSKVALVAYHRFCGEADPAAQGPHLDAHCTALRAHVADLATKDYPSLYGFEACEAVVMCVPTDAALLDGLRHDLELATYAQERRVVLASPSLLQPMLVIISQMWRLDAQHRNAQEMARRVGSLCDKLRDGAEAFEEVGRQLDRASSAFQTARGRLFEGRGNVLRQHEMLRELGAPTRRGLPPDLAELAALGDGADDEHEVDDAPGEPPERAQG